MALNDSRYGSLDAKLVAKLKSYEYDYFREDLPVPFKTLKIYPATVRDFEIFSSCTSCLTLDKNETPQGIRMTNLDYLISKLQDPNEGGMWSFRLQKLCEIIFHIKNGLKCKKCQHIITYDSPEFTKFLQAAQSYAQQATTLNPEGIPSLHCPECNETDFTEMVKIAQNPETKKYYLIVDGCPIENQDFNELRQIVLFQNYYDYADESGVDPELKKDREEKMKIEQKQNNLHATIEKKVVCLSVTTNYKFQEIYDMSIRKFTMAIATVDDLINYKIMKQATMSGFVSLPKGKTVEHWIYKPDKDMYGDAYKSTDSLKADVSNL